VQRTRDSRERYADVRKIGLLLAKTAGLIVLLDLAVFYFKLGFFLYPVWAVGAGLALLVSWKEIRALRPSIFAVILTLLAYAVISKALWPLLFDQRSSAVFSMTWQDKGTDNDFGEPEVVLEFERFPGRYIGIYSDQLHDYLVDSGQRVVPVTFRVTRDLGCLRGFSERRIGDLTTWRSAFSYAGGASDPPSPWGEDPWWCP
jgi:hypothetical protein